MPRLSGLTLTPYWWEEAPRPKLPEASLPATVDALVVGSGYTGLSAALTLARAGRSVLVCEAEEPGHGASSRNGGGVGTQPFKLGFASMERLFGRERAIRVYREGISSVDYMENLIRAEQIQCHFVRSGRFLGAWRPRDYEAMAREVELLTRHVGYPMAMLSRAEQDRQIATDVYHGGRVNAGDGVVHPGLYHQGLLERVMAAGAQIAAHTPVVRVERAASGFLVHTPRGKVTTRDVLVGTNGYTGDSLPYLARRLIPVASQIIATEPLAPERVHRLLPAANMIVDSKHTVHYYRTSPDGTRILMGGRPTLGEALPEVSAGHLRQFMIRVFPELQDVRISHSWGGRLGFTFDKLPHIGVADGIRYASGYLGSGVAMSTWLGHKMAEQALGRADGATALDGRDFPSMPFYRGRPWFLSGVALWYRLLDKLP
jgi:glycine/D-amino acid oxidase-like deaminating enzyme